MRDDGKTTKQLKTLAKNAVFIWCNGRLDYPRNLAKNLNREDVLIVSPYWLESRKWLGCEFSQIELDHAAELTSKQWEYFKLAITRVRNVS